MKSNTLNAIIMWAGESFAKQDRIWLWIVWNPKCQDYDIILVTLKTMFNVRWKEKSEQSGRYGTMLASCHLAGIQAMPVSNWAMLHHWQVPYLVTASTPAHSLPCFHFVKIWFSNTAQHHGIASQKQTYKQWQIISNTFFTLNRDIFLHSNASRKCQEEKKCCG